MSTRPIVICAFLVMAFGLAVQDAHSQQRPKLNWETIWIPANERGVQDPVRDIKLEANIVKPDGKGPFPVAIISHGSTGRGRVPVRQTLRSDFVASEFLKHGFAVVAPMRRGRGASGGAYDEPYDCDASAAAGGLQNAMQDTDHVVAYVRTRPEFDSSRLVLSGNSRGGILSVLYASQRLGVARGVVNFVGVWTNDTCSSRAGGFNEKVFRDAGTAPAAAHVPMLFLYAGNDSHYAPDSARNFAALVQQSGGSVQLQLYGAVGSDGHRLFAHPDVWGPDFHGFLDKLGFPRVRE